MNQVENRRFYELRKQLKAVRIFNVAPEISTIAYLLVKKYKCQHSLLPADALIAPTAKESNFHFILILKMIILS
jgi:predicted nucleic acid-binding protein